MRKAYRTAPGPLIRALIVHVIWQHRLPASIDFLAAAVDDPHPEVWEQALDGLVTLASPAAKRVLQVAAGRTTPEDGGRRAWFEV